MLSSSSWKSNARAFSPDQSSRQLCLPRAAGREIPSVVAAFQDGVTILRRLREDSKRESACIRARLTLYNRCGELMRGAKRISG